MEWCDDGHKDKGYEIKTAKAEIEASKTKIEELGASISTDEADLKAASEIRAKESAEFKATEEELSEAIGMLDRAINILERKMKGSASLMQAKYNSKDLKSLLS